MKILYAVQATGNGHIARAIELLPMLETFGKVDIFLSGSNSQLNGMLPVIYRSKGISLFYGKSGGLDYQRILKSFAPFQIWRDIQNIPVEQYDWVLNDFEPVCALACRLKKVPSLGIGHQASFHSKNVPRPKKREVLGETILKKYAPASKYIGFHFNSYDSWILQPIIKHELIDATPTNQGHITVYLPQFGIEELTKAFYWIRDRKVEIFTTYVNEVTQVNQLKFIPPSHAGFTESMLHASTVITAGGFETPAEALYLGKRLMVIPIKGQYEQACNAAALKDMGVPVLHSLEDIQNQLFYLMQQEPSRRLDYAYSMDILKKQIEWHWQNWSFS